MRKRTRSDLFVGFDMDIACLLADGVHQDKVDQFYNRRLLGCILEEGEVHFLGSLDQVEIDLILQHSENIFQGYRSV